MSISSKLFKTYTIAGLVALGAFLFFAITANAKNSGHLFFCINNTRTWTLYESSQPRMFQQEVSVQGPGTFTLTMEANGFGFEGFSYTKPSAWDKWKYVSKTSKGKRSWRQTWRVSGDNQQLGLLQLIKDNNNCRSCTITMRMTSSGCKAPSSRPRSSGHYCAVNQCWTGGTGGVYGIARTCYPRPGWNGSRCP